MTKRRGTSNAHCNTEQQVLHCIRQASGLWRQCTKEGQPLLHVLRNRSSNKQQRLVPAAAYLARESIVKEFVEVGVDWLGERPDCFQQHTHVLHGTRAQLLDPGRYPVSAAEERSQYTFSILALSKVKQRLVHWTPRPVGALRSIG